MYQIQIKDKSMSAYTPHFAEKSLNQKMILLVFCTVSIWMIHFIAKYNLTYQVL